MIWYFVTQVHVCADGTGVSKRPMDVPREDSFIWHHVLLAFVSSARFCTAKSYMGEDRSHFLNTIVHGVLKGLVIEVVETAISD